MDVKLQIKVVYVWNLHTTLIYSVKTVRLNGITYLMIYLLEFKYERYLNVAGKRWIGLT